MASESEIEYNEDGMYMENCRAINNVTSIILDTSKTTFKEGGTIETISANYGRATIEIKVQNGKLVEIGVHGLHNEPQSEVTIYHPKTTKVTKKLSKGTQTSWTDIKVIE